MDLFGDIDDISSESDGDSKQTIPGQPAVSTITSTGPVVQSKRKFQRLKGLTPMERGY